MTLNDNRPQDAITLDEIRETIGHMRTRMDAGDCATRSTSCRLSLPMSEELLRLLTVAQTDLDAALSLLRRPLERPHLAPAGPQCPIDTCTRPLWPWDGEICAVCRDEGFEAPAATATATADAVIATPLDEPPTKRRRVMDVTEDEIRAGKWERSEPQDDGGVLWKPYTPPRLGQAMNHQTAWEREQAFNGLFIVRRTSQADNPTNRDSRTVHPRPILDDPWMSGKPWVAVGAISEEMCAAWPVWQYREYADMDPSEWTTLTDWVMRAPTHGSVRPLRLPGMNAKGVIHAEDMTQRHWALVADWQWLDEDGGWNDSRVTTTIASMEWLNDGAALWRPKAFAQLNDEARATPDAVAAATAIVDDALGVAVEIVRSLAGVHTVRTVGDHSWDPIELRWYRDATRPNWYIVSGDERTLLALPTPVAEAYCDASSVLLLRTQEAIDAVMEGRGRSPEPTCNCDGVWISPTVAPVIARALSQALGSHGDASDKPIIREVMAKLEVVR